MITTVIFDIGMVLAYFRGREMFEDMGIVGENFETIVNATIRNPMWNEFDRSLMSDEDIIAKCVEREPEYEQEIRQIFVAV